MSVARDRGHDSLAKHIARYRQLVQNRQIKDIKSQIRTVKVAIYEVTLHADTVLSVKDRQSQYRQPDRRNSPLNKISKHKSIRLT